MTSLSRKSADKKNKTGADKTGKNSLSGAPGEVQFRRLAETLPVMVYMVEPNPPYAPIFVNRAFESLGYSLREWRQSPDFWLRVLHPDDREWVLRKTEAAMQAGEEIDYEYRVVTRDGEVRWVRDRGCFVRDENGETVCWQGIILDITDRKAAAEALVESEMRYRNLYESANDVMYIHDLAGNYLSINGAAERVFGYTQDEALRMNLKQVIAPDQLKLARRMMSEKIRGAGQTVYEIDCVTKDGRRITLEINSCLIYKDGRAVAVQGVARDVTERRQAEKALRNSEAELRALFAAMTDVILVLDAEGRYLKIAPTNPSLLYKPDEDLIGKTLHEVFPKPQADYFLNGIRKALKTGESVRMEYTLNINGQDVYFVAVVSPMMEDSVIFVATDITERKRSEEDLKQSEEKYRDLFENANDLIYTHDLQGFFTSLNRAGEIITGYKREEVVNTGFNIAQVVAPECLAQAREMTARKIAGGAPTAYELEIIAKDGRRVSLELSTRLILQDGKPVGVQGIGRDITARKLAEEELVASERRYRLLGEGIMHQVWTASPDGRLDYVNGRTLEYFGRTLEQMLGDGWQEVVHPDDLRECLRRWKRSLETGEYYEIEFRLLAKDGNYRWHLGRATAGRDTDGKIIKWFGTNTDIHEQKIAEAQLSHYARHDPLTGLPNRAAFMYHLREAIERASAEPEFGFAVLFLDLDRFKLINDGLGHVTGDKLLIAIAERLQESVRPRDIVARLGGDEFTILLNRSGQKSDVLRVAERIQRNLAAPYRLDGYEVFTSASIGIIFSDSGRREPEDYLRDADTAMYLAKEKGKARCEVFDREMHVRNLNLLRVETDLRHAVERGEFEVFYQPIVSLATGQIKEFEALIRWRHPELGLIAPDEFISVAEETGLIIPIGRWVIEEACRQTAEWQKQFPLLADTLSVSVNLSAKQLMHPSLTTQVAEILSRNGLNPRFLKLEVTESNVMEHSDTALNVLNELRLLGVSLSTDDFGTGYSSLSYLHRFPFKRLKIDRSFVSKMDADEKSEAIVRTILMLGRNLDIEAVAEGIETETQLEILRALKCPLGQGYLFSKPVSAKAAEKLLSQGLAANSYNSPAVYVAPGADNSIIEMAEVQ